MSYPKSKAFLFIFLFVALMILGVYELIAVGVQTAVASPLAAMNVTIGDSSWTDDGQCSLREAIANANQDTQVFTSAGECPAGNGTDIVTLDVDVTLTITDNNADGVGANGLPVITSSITISGAGHVLARDVASPPFRFFYVNENSSNLTLQNLTLVNGDATTNPGGAINLTRGGLVVEGTTFSGNQASAGGAIYRTNANSVLIKINNSRFITNHATLRGGAINQAKGRSDNAVLNSLFVGNSSQDGGAIAFNGFMNVANSTFINNSATGTGGALRTSNQYNPHFFNITVISNTAPIGGGLYSFNGDSTPWLYNSIISGNSASVSGDDCGGSSLDDIEAKNNLFGINGDVGGCTGFAVTSANNITAAGALSTIVATDGNGNAILADNGGEIETIALVSNSPAINNGDNMLLPDESTLGIDGDGDGNVDDPIDYDQRSITRPQNGVCDSGAFERIPLVLTGTLPMSNIAHLDWNDTIHDGYELWRSMQPYSDYAIIGSYAISEEDVPVDPSQNYYYEVYGVLETDTAEVSNRVGVFTFPIVAGN